MYHVPQPGCPPAKEVRPTVQRLELMSEEICTGVRWLLWTENLAMVVGGSGDGGGDGAWARVVCVGTDRVKRR